MGCRSRSTSLWLTATDYRLIASNDALDFLSLSPFAGTDLRASEDFVEIYQSMVGEYGGGNASRAGIDTFLTGRI